MKEPKFQNTITQSEIILNVSLTLILISLSVDAL